MEAVNETLALDLSTLTIGELELLEEVSGLSFEEIAVRLREKRLNAKLLIAVVLMVKRRVAPETTIDDVRSMNLFALDMEIEGDVDADPTAAAGSNG